MKVNKKTKYQLQLAKTDAAIYEAFNKLISEGYARTNAYKYLMRKYIKNSNATIWLAVQRETKRREENKVETINNNYNETN